MIHECCILRVPCETFRHLHQSMTDLLSQQVFMIYTVCGKSLTSLVNLLSHVFLQTSCLTGISYSVAFTNQGTHPVGLQAGLIVRECFLQVSDSFPGINGLYVVVNGDTRNCVYIISKHTEIKI